MIYYCNVLSTTIFDCSNLKGSETTLYFEICLCIRINFARSTDRLKKTHFNT